MKSVAAVVRGTGVKGAGKDLDFGGMRARWLVYRVLDSSAPPPSLRCRGAITQILLVDASLASVWCQHTFASAA